MSSKLAGLGASSIVQELTAQSRGSLSSRDDRATRSAQKSSSSPVTPVGSGSDSVMKRDIQVRLYE
eukprot:212388-Amorphochlora_amoeboformis.AAC.1